MASAPGVYTLGPLRIKLDALIENAPKQAQGRPPTPEEIAEQTKFKMDVKELLVGVPPESGLTYKSVMKRVKASYAPKPAANSKPKQPPPEKKKKPPKADNNEETDATPPVDYLCVLDFEATCDNIKPPLEPQEIIEFPTLLVDAKTGTIVDTFHHYIKPDVYPRLSSFCTELTGITQDVVDGGLSLDDVLVLHEQWLDHHNIISEGEDPFHQSDKKRFLYVTCGDWDFKTCLPKQLSHHGKETHPRFHSWINLKYAYVAQYNQNVRGMTCMLNNLGLKLEGRHHSGIDDCKNIARICSKMLDSGWVPRATRGAKNAGSKLYWNFHKDRGWPAEKSNRPHKTVFLVRHGQSLGQATSLGDRKNNPKLQDCGLSEKGRKEASDIRNLFGTEMLESVELVVSSPLTRALSTAVLGFPDHDIVVDYDIAEIGNDLPENKARTSEEVLKELATDLSKRGQSATIDVDSLKPDGWPLPTRKQSHAKRIRNSLKALYKRNETSFAIVCHYKVIKEMIVGKQGNLAPVNAVPIKCFLFQNGDLGLA